VAINIGVHCVTQALEARCYLVELQRQFLALRRAGALPLQARLERRSLWSCALLTHREPPFLPSQVTLQLHFRCSHELRTLSETFHIPSLLCLPPWLICRDFDARRDRNRRTGQVSAGDSPQFHAVAVAWGRPHVERSCCRKYHSTGNLIGGKYWGWGQPKSTHHKLGMLGARGTLTVMGEDAG